MLLVLLHAAALLGVARTVGGAGPGWSKPRNPKCTCDDPSLCESLPPVAARVPSQWIETLQRRFTESTVLCYALDDEAGGADACERAVQASIERMGHREAGRAAKRHRR